MATKVKFAHLWTKDGKYFGFMERVEDALKWAKKDGRGFVVNDQFPPRRTIDTTLPEEAEVTAPEQVASVDEGLTAAIAATRAEEAT